MPGVVTCAQVLRAVLSAVPIDAVNTMMYETDGPLRPDRRPARLGRVPRGDPRGRARRSTLEPIEKWDFYEAVATPDHVLTIQTADQQRFANILLSVGVRMD